ncbi:MAG TPA: hypothetical protein PLG57_05940 [Bacteroidia bacterium]|nr:hypothetical protein [Bacteroidia bacterium]
MANNYQPGWKLARLAVWDATAADYVPIACITSRSESNASNVMEKTNACTQGKTVKTITGITRTVSVSGEVVTDNVVNSLDDLRALQDSLTTHDFKVYRTSGVDGATETAWYFSATISNLNADYPTGEGESATFTMDLNIEGEYSNVEPTH